ncbi:MAG TPA: class I SAM-dependent methyltransferase [Dehalococcoidia bacterium]|nr:class I SAM-dependent methyltransferase [Dehalococcoidia bacterium]
MTARVEPVAKQAYYEGRALPAGLAARYYREFAGARRILDLGCGAGDFGRLRPDPEVEVHGVDVDPLAVALASRYEIAAQVDLEREALPYPDAWFDGVLAKDVFEHLREPAHAAREAYRVLRPGGVLVASVVMARPSRVWADYTHVRGFTREAARLLLEDAGFAVEAIWRMGPVPLSSRLGFVGLVPALLRVPLLDWLWGASWELRARK